MNVGHVQSGDHINLEHLRDDLNADSTYALVKTPSMEVIRMALPHGKYVEEHSVSGEVSIQCLQGEIIFNIAGRALQLSKNDWLYLKKDQVFSYSVKSATILLVTILFTNHK